MFIADKFLDILSQYFQRLSHNRFRSGSGIVFSGMVIAGVFHFGFYDKDELSCYSFHVPISDPKAIEYVVDTVKQLKPGAFHG